VCTGLREGTAGAGQVVKRGPCLHWAECGYGRGWAGSVKRGVCALG
jgi:hypothetical protein